jgi:hypothetical protein
MNAFSRTFKDLKTSLQNMLLKGIHSFEDGFEILDIDLEIDEHLTVDVMAKDARGNPTVVLMAEFGEANLIHRLLNTLCRLKRHKFLLQHIYRKQGFDFSVPPRILLLSPRFSDDFIEALDFIVAGDIVPYEYASVRMDDKEVLTFSRRDIEEGDATQAFELETGNDLPEWSDAKPGDKMRTDFQAPPPPETGRTEFKVPLTPSPETRPKPKSSAKSSAKSQPKSQMAEAKPESDGKHKKKKEKGHAEKFFHEAKKKILRISNDIIVDEEGPLSRFKIGDLPLVTLSMKNDELGAYLGDTDQVLLKIDSEAKLNEALNQIFKRYFTTFSSISRH